MQIYKDEFEVEMFTNNSTQGRCPELEYCQQANTSSYEHRCWSKIFKFCWIINQIGASITPRKLVEPVLHDDG